MALVSVLPADAHNKPTGVISQSSQLAALAKPIEITLLTGDTVSYSVDGGGNTAIAVRPAAGRGNINFRAYSDATGYYVIPSDAEAGFDTGVLDKKLFDVKYLSTSGYGDDRVGELPVILQYITGSPSKAMPPDTTKMSDLPSIRGEAVKVGKKHAKDFWESIRGVARPNAGRVVVPRLGYSLNRIWLDARVRSLDDVSDPQIGATTAWAAGLDGTGVTVGIVDTGIDETHPDLQGKVLAAQNFVPAGFPGGGDPTDVTDRFGHGTHVASIIAGTGVASGGLYKGIALGAKLVIAKALDDGGSGDDSWIIAAMQWEAATEHTRVVSMSLGGAPTDGTDPLSQAVDNLTAQDGTLFVIAAGNSGPSPMTVASPGAATAALTVGAVDRNDQLAFFSSRGPRLGDFAVKPEITAPGVDIVGARAAGTSLGQAVGEFYTILSGTSMATPHVAGSAAILLEKHPAWTEDQLKDVLIATAHDDGYTAYEQGSGRVDIGRAATQNVFDDTPDISAHFTYPYTGEALTRPVTYRNLGQSPVTLRLSLNVARSDGTPAGPMVALDETSVTVSPGGAASVNVALDPTTGLPGGYTGRLLASDAGGDQVSLPIAFFKQVKQDTLTVRLTGVQDKYLLIFVPLEFIRVNDTDPMLADEPQIGQVFDWTNTSNPDVIQATLQLADTGIYHIDTVPTWQDLAGQQSFTNALLSKPQVTINGDSTLTFDLRQVVPVQVKTAQASISAVLNWGWSRTTASGINYSSFVLASYPSAAPDILAVLPTAVPPTIGKFKFWVNDTRIAPQVLVTVYGNGQPVALQPLYIDQPNNEVRKFNSNELLPVAGEGELLSSQAVAGKLVFVEQPVSVSALVSDIDAAIKLGAAGVITDSWQVWRLSDAPERQRIPLLWIDSGHGAQLHALLAISPQPHADIRAQTTTPYEYKLVFFVDQVLPSSMTFAPSDSDLTQIQTVYHAEYAAPGGPLGSQPDTVEASLAFRPDQRLLIQASDSFASPASRTEFFNTTGPNVLWDRLYEFFEPPAFDTSRTEESFRGFVAATREHEDWNEAALPGQFLLGTEAPAWTPSTIDPCDICRQGDILRVRSAGVPFFFQASAVDQGHQFQDPSSEEVHLFAGNTEITPNQDAFGLLYYSLPAASSTYRFTDSFQDPGPHLGSAVNTTWTFTSARASGDDVAAPYACIDSILFADHDPCAWQSFVNLTYHLSLASDDTAPAGAPFSFTITAQDGVPGGNAALTSVHVWISSDRGHSWTAAQVVALPNNRFLVLVHNPVLSGAATGFVTLRAVASDAAGNSVDQTIVDAYNLSSPTAG